jgi:hypothetical protein
MVPLCRVAGGFEAQVLAARLGSEGVIVELRGGGTSMWPGGAVEVLVAESDLEVARELLLSDEVESALDGGDDDAEAQRVLPWWVVAVALLLLATFVLAAFAGRLRVVG